ncbi:hypothetical protein CLV60_108156 [Dyadobacter jiangsuensis]|uniref:Uncharacterized protein n=1 Tax=Dyadobacter jiangsuensis TaxID=1591085 RepID=A0A2P8FZZ7_9BACT|nr:hypothetical protein CLV60_108156 [Dyadobacter jiangsuensis]
MSGGNIRIIAKQLFLSKSNALPSTQNSTKIRNMTFVMF